MAQGPCCTTAVLPEFGYFQVPARFHGFEAQAALRLLDAGRTLDLELGGDLLRAVSSNTGEALPRIAPARLKAALLWPQGPCSARPGANRAMAQTALPVGELATAGYGLFNAALR